MHRRLVAGLMVVCMLVGCTHTVSFDPPGALQVPQKIRAQVDPQFWALKQHFMVGNFPIDADVGAALQYILEEDAQSPYHLRYVSSQGIGTSTAHITYRLTVLWGREEPLMLVEGHGLGYSHYTAPRSGRAAIEAALLDLHRKLTALAANDDAR